MAKHIENEIAYYYDFHPTEEDLMGETSLHRSLIDSLALVLKWLYQGQLCAIYENLNFYQTANPKEYPLAPDIAVIKGVSFQYVRSWRVGKTGPAPQVVFEIASEETWNNDLHEKPGKYARMGVAEYFAYDPNEHPLDRKTARRLFGWQLDPTEGVMREMRLRSDGSLWSAHLQSMLVPQSDHLRLYDRQGHLRLTQAEAEARRAEIEARRGQLMAEKLRSLGIDPDQL
jgi:Uma2 family endonuclease